MSIASIGFANPVLPLRPAAAPTVRNDTSVGSAPSAPGLPPAPGSVPLAPAGRDRSDVPSPAGGVDGSVPGSVGGSAGRRHIIFA
jgi:hypothetical protein